MNKRNWIVGIALGIAVLAAPITRADEEKKDEPRWDTSFAGHEMWSHDLEASIALAVKEGRPMLVDFYGLH